LTIIAKIMCISRTWYVRRW